MGDLNKITDTAIPSKSMEAREAATVTVKDKQPEESGDKRNIQLKQKRLKFLKDALDKVFSRVSAGKLSWYIKQFPTLQRQDPGILKLLRDQVVHQLETTIKTEIETMLEEENIMEIMKDLDQTINNCKAQKTSIAWRPTGNVDDDIRAHLIPVKMKLRDNLQSMLSKLEEENQQLQNIVCQRQNALTKMEQKVNDYNSYFEKIAVNSEVIKRSPDLSDV